MDIRFYIDPETGYPHMYWHGIQEYEVEDVLEQPREDTPGRRNSRIAIGQTKSGRYLQVVYVRVPRAGDIFVITAYELRGRRSLHIGVEGEEAADEKGQQFPARMGR